jgi:hypothetical protein
LTEAGDHLSGRAVLDDGVDRRDVAHAVVARGRPAGFCVCRMSPVWLTTNARARSRSRPTHVLLAVVGVLAVGEPPFGASFRPAPALSDNVMRMMYPDLRTTPSAFTIPIERAPTAD